jgi:hypothetical protein
VTRTGPCEHGYAGHLYCPHCGARAGCPALCARSPDHGLACGCGLTEGHPLPHHDPGSHRDWEITGAGTLAYTERRPYVCTWSQTRYADGIVRINPDQPPCPVCEPA